MKIFHCNHCQHLVFFESFQCVSCGHSLAYLPDLQVLGSLEPAGDNHWRTPIPEARGRTYRRCSNYELENICNWAVSSEDPNPLCQSCRLTKVIPDLSLPGNREAWYRMEVAKRRVVYSLLSLDLSLEPSGDDKGPVFEFLADLPGAGPALTGHNAGPSRSTSRRPTMRSARGGERRCTSRTAPCSGTSAMRSAITTGTG